MILQQLVNTLILGSNYALMAIGLTIVYGILGIVNLAHGEIFMVGAFVAYFMVAGLQVNFFVALLGAMVCMAVLGIIIERGLFRKLRGGAEVNYFILSMGLLIVLQNAALLLWGTDPHSMSLPAAAQVIELGAVMLTTQRLIIVATAVVIIIALHFFVKYSKMGMSMRGVEQNFEGATTVGISINKVASFTFALSGALAGAAGALLGSLYIVQATMGFSPLIKAFTVVVLGGLGSIMGAIVGGLVLAAAEIFGGVYISSDYQETFSFIILIIVLSIKPSGIFGKQ
jgi:branched-chain amino acid transport system permease protein